MHKLLRKIAALAKDGDFSFLFKKAFSAFAIRAFGAVFSFGFNLYLARKLGAEGSGRFILGYTVLNMAVIFGMLGKDKTLMKHTAIFLSQSAHAKLKGLYLYSMKRVSISALASTGALALSAYWLAGYVFRDRALEPILLRMSLAVVPVVWATVHSELARGFKLTGWSAALQTQVGPVVWGVCLGLLLLSDAMLTVETVTLFFLAAVTMVTLLGFVKAATMLPGLRTLRPEYEVQEFSSESRVIFWIALLPLIKNWTAPLLLAIWFDSAEVGIFGNAFRVASLTNFVLFAVNSIAAPEFAEVFKKGDGDMWKLQGIARKSSFLMLVAVAPLIAPMLLFPSWVMGLFGEEFVVGNYVLVILAIGQLVNVATGSVGQMLMVCGEERALRMNLIVNNVIHLLLIVTLTPAMGMIGAALAVGFMLVSTNIASLVLVRVRLGISVLPMVYPSGLEKPQRPQS